MNLQATLIALAIGAVIGLVFTGEKIGALIGSALVGLILLALAAYGEI